MHAVRLPIPLHHPLGAGIQRSVPLESTVTTATSRLDVRDHRDDSSLIGGLLIALGLGILAWALIIALLWVLL